MNKRLLTYTSYLYLMTYAFTVTSIGPCNAPIAHTFNIGERAMGFLISFHFVGFITSVFYAGYLIDKVGLRQVMLGGVAVLGLSLIGFGQARSLPVLFVMMFLSGAGGGAMEASVNALISNLYGRTRVYSLNLLHVYFGVGAFTWPTVAGFLLHSGVSWRALYVLIGVISLIIAGLIAMQRFQQVEREEMLRFRDMALLLRNPTVLLLGAAIACYVGAEMGINAWIVRYFDEVLLRGQPLTARLHVNLGYTEIDAGLTSSIFLTLYWFTMTVGRIFSTLAGRVVPDTTLLRAMTLLSLITAIATFITSDYIMAAILLGLTGLFFSGIFATTVAIGGNRFPSNLGIISGIIIGFSALGNIIFNAAIGEIAQASGLRAAMLFAAALLVIMTLCAFLVRRTRSED
ncbi:MAG: MFS transporter [bacterium]